MKKKDKKEKKVTLMLPEELLNDAMEFTGKGVTPTIREGLEVLRIRAVCKRLLASKGSMPDLDIDIKASREDRKLW